MSPAAKAGWRSRLQRIEDIQIRFGVFWGRRAFVLLFLFALFAGAALMLSAAVRSPTTGGIDRTVVLKITGPGSVPPENPLPRRHPDVVFEPLDKIAGSDF